MNPPNMTEVPPDKPYQIKRAFLQVELEFYDPSTGKVNGTGLTSQAIIFEADFGRTVQSLIEEGKLTPTPYTPKQETKSK